MSNWRQASPIYAPQGSRQLNEKLHWELAGLSNGLQSLLGDNLQALILGGGYGRGEGGVVSVHGEEGLYNDLDLFLVVGNKKRASRTVLEPVLERAQARLGIEVDVSRPLTVEDITGWRRELRWHDLLHGHVVVSGPEDILHKNAPAWVTGPPAAIEASRLMLNRGAGLLWSLRVVRGLEPAPDADFIRRNYFKALLGIGDALLLVHGGYESSYSGRLDAFRSLVGRHPEISTLNLVGSYEAALEFRFRPDATAAVISASRLRTASSRWGRAWLYVESMRTARRWESHEQYASWKGIREKHQHTPRAILRNFAQNVTLREFSGRYPREVLYRELPSLLGLSQAGPANWAKGSEAFLRVWRRFN